MRASDRFAPRALLIRPTIAIEVTPSELHMLIKALETAATRAADDVAQLDFCDYLLRRVAELREAGR